MKRLLIILGLAYIAGRVIGAHVERRCLEREAEARRRARAHRVRVDYTMPFYSDSHNSQEVPHVR